MVQMTEADSHPSKSAQLAVGSHIAQALDGSTAIVAVFQAAPPRSIDPAEITAAEDLLTELPVDSLPDPSGLPPGSVLPWQRNRFFIGRHPVMLELARQIKQGGTAAVGQSPAITGMGGQGKTQLAVEFAYRFGRWFKGGVFWIDCSDPITIPEAIAVCGLALYPADAGFSARPLPEQLALVASTWASDLPRLLIFDNCEDEPLLDAWVPKGGGCRLLITARRTNWSPQRGITALPLGVLTRQESLALLHRHRPDLAIDDPGLNGIAEELGDLPLALELAGSYLARYRHESIGTPASYLAELRREDLLAHESLQIAEPRVLGQPRTLTGHERDVARTFEVSLRRLQAASSVDMLARRIFACAAGLAPGLPIPRHLLKLGVGIGPDDDAAVRSFNNALERLLDLALLEGTNEGRTVTLHRLLATFARMRLEEAAASQQAIAMAMAKEAGRYLENDDPRPIRDWAGHLIAAAQATGSEGTKTAISLLNGAGIYSRVIGDFETSEAMLQDAAKQANSWYGPQHPQVANILNNLGNVQRERGDLTAAEANLTLALEIQERVYGPDHPDVGRTLSNLGIVQSEHGNAATAESNFTRAIGIFEKVYGSDHIYLGGTLSNLGNLQRVRGDLTAAEANLTRALEIQERAYGPDHPSLGATLINLGSVHINNGDFVSAEASLSRALEINKRVHGPDHPSVAYALSNLGKVYLAKGDFVSAETNLTRALEIKEKFFDADHPEIVRALGNLSHLQSTGGNLPGAAVTQIRIIALLENKLGPDHQEVAEELGRLGYLQRRLGRVSDARASFSRAASIFALRLGEQNHNTLFARQLIHELDGITEGRSGDHV